MKKELHIRNNKRINIVSNKRTTEVVDFKKQNSIKKHAKHHPLEKPSGILANNLAKMSEDELKLGS